tara:strand:- start:2552 stop:3016 length:465 start_codon:yes stop_codon:yes gene_type:complete
MATLTPTLTLALSGLHSDTVSLSVTDTLAVTAPAGSIQKISTGANPLGQGVGVLLTEAATIATTYIYLKHTGKLASDGTTACHAANDFVVLTNEDGDHNFIKLQPEEFCFFPLLEFDGADDPSVEPGGLKVEGGGVGSGGAAHVMVEFGYWTKE